jgi:hypothetical protein
MPCEENTSLTETEVDLLATYRSWARKGTLVDKLRQKMDKLAARENIPRDKPVPVPRPPPPPPDMSVPYHPMDGCGPALKAMMAEEETEAERRRRRRNSCWDCDSDSEDDEWDRYDHSDPRVAAAFAAMSAPGYVSDQYSLECELALRGYYDDPPGEEPLPVRGGKK